MFNHLNPRTREIVRKLCEGQPVELGGRTVGPFDDGAIQVLRVLVSNFSELTEKSGQELAEKFVEHFDRMLTEQNDRGDQAHEESEEIAPEQQTTEKHIQGYKIGLIRACSFRGLAPAGQEWAYDFKGKPHLLYGPNGCGKSSLLGAISWCLTGCIFRDDRAPAVPENVRAYSIEQNRRMIERSDALSLIDQSGKNTSPSDKYWVEMQFVSENAEGTKVELWIRRHNEDGLSKSEDGIEWTSIGSIAETDIDELDAELNILMPARVSHIRFGKDTKLIHILAQIIGLYDLEAIAGLADKVCRALRTEATRVNNREIEPEKVKITDFVGSIKQTDNNTVKELSSYTEVIADTRKLADIEIFGKAMTEAIENKEKQLAKDLGIEIPEEDTAAYKERKEEVANLPGQVQNAIDELQKPLAEIFDSSIGFDVPTKEALSELERKLDAFEKDTRMKVTERLRWALEEKRDSKASLMLVAAGYFPEGSNDCPVCTQDLKPVPQIKKQLDKLRPLAGQAYLRKELDDLELLLTDELEQIAALTLREQGEKTFHERIISDWSNLKQQRFKGFLLPIADKFDEGVQSIAEETRVEEEIELAPLAEGYYRDFPAAFSKLDQVLCAAKSYVQLCKSVLENVINISGKLGTLLTAPKTEGVEYSLSAILERGRATNQDIMSLRAVYKTTKDLWRSMKKEKELGDRISKYRTLTDAGETTKELAETIRREVIEVVKELESQMKGYFSRLYENEILILDMLTTGNPANPDVKDEINVYLRAGNQRVPIGPFCNAGRMRALILSFIFALLKKSTGSLGIIVLDDPVLSLDHEHKARFVDYMVEPLLAETQVIMATHYLDFCKVAERAFSNSERLWMPPRRSEVDGVSFEPGDLFKRVERALKEPSCSWREVGNNLRFWVERTLATLSGYCPMPFVIFNNIPGSVKAYKKIGDPRVATQERDRIVEALESPQVERIRYSLAHDKDPAESDVRDGLEVLKKCEGAVQAEIKRFKDLYEHQLLARAIDARPSVKILSLKDYIGDWKLNTVGRAAAAQDGVVVFWEEYEVYQLARCQIAILKAGTIAPIGLIGQYLLLDSEERRPENSDLVVVETQDKKRYVRRFWTDEDKTIWLEAANPTKPYKPIKLSDGEHLIRRVVGVLFDGVSVKPAEEGDEWTPGRLPDKWTDDVVGVRVEGTSLEPIAREGQIVLVSKRVGKKVTKADVACVDIVDKEAVIKRCYPSEPAWVLCSINPNEVQDPISVSVREIRNAYPLVGVLFEVNSAVTVGS